MLCNICLECGKIAPNCCIIALKAICKYCPHISNLLGNKFFPSLWYMQAFCTSFVLAKWSGFLYSDFFIPFLHPFWRAIFMMAYIPLWIFLVWNYFWKWTPCQLYIILRLWYLICPSSELNWTDNLLHGGARVSTTWGYWQVIFNSYTQQ